jgi:phenylalanyl-tRNA synthetase beta chain
MRHEQVARILGYVVEPEVCVRILTRLGFDMVPTARDSERAPVWEVTVPSWRVDITREVDLVEEVGRQHGYDRIPTTFPALKTVPPSPDARLERDHIVRQVLRASGFHEAQTLAFIERSAALPFADEGTLAPIANPLSEKFAVLRPSLLPGLVDSLAHNRRREQRDIRLFESANTFTRQDGERRRVAFVWTGHASAPHWSGSGRLVDVFDATGVVSTLCTALGLEALFVPASRGYLSPTDAGAVQVRPARDACEGGEKRRDDVREIGVLGQLLPALADARGIPGNEPVYVCEIDLDAVTAWTDIRDRLTVTTLPRHPSVVRDVSISVNADLPAAQVRDTIRAAAPATLERIVEFDRYQGKGVPEGQSSLSLRLTFRAPDRTLTDAEVQDAMDRIVAALSAQHGATLR